MPNKKHYFLRKIIDIICVSIIALYAIVGIAAYIFGGFSNSVFSNIYLISLGAVLFVILTFIVIETILYKHIIKNVKCNINAKTYTDSIKFLEQIPKIGIYCGPMDCCSYYKGILYLYLNDVDKAIINFKDIDLQKNYSQADVQLSSILYLYLIYISTKKEDEAEKVYKGNVKNFV